MVVKKGESGHNGGGRPMPYRTAPDNPARPVFAECFKDLGLPEISAARFCRVSAVLLSLRCPRGFSPGERRAQFQTRHIGTAHPAHTISIAPGKTKHTAQQC